MKHVKQWIALLLCGLLLLTAAGCGKEDTGASDFAPSEDNQYATGGTAMNTTGDGTPGKDSLGENPFISAAKFPTSTFSADVDTASYALFRKLVASGYSPEELTKHTQETPFRTEEMINYFDYRCATPAEGELFGTTASITKAPWNDRTYLMTLGLATETPEEKGANNLVFLIDVSGSMAAKDKLPLLKDAFSVLVSALDGRDTVSIVTYSGREAIILEGCAGNRDEEILSAIRNLNASGATNGQSGLQKAYELAAKYRKEDGNNRIIMASDGDLNVGISSPEELTRFISEQREGGIFLSILGFGTGNYRDDTMSALAQNGNGVYYYIDSPREAEKVMGTDLLSTLYTVAKDVKLQLTFDPAYVSEYRLIGYENRLLSTEDFENDEKDAGDVGAGHTVTVCYELKLTEQALSETGKEATWATLAMRYKLPEATESTLKEHSLGGALLTEIPSEEHRFLCAVIETTMILNGSVYNQKQITLPMVLDSLNSMDLSADPDRQEFKSLIGKLIG